jgi:hypothetical protein
MSPTDPVPLFDSDAEKWRAAADELDQAERPEAARIARLMAEEAELIAVAEDLVWHQWRIERILQRVGWPDREDR